MAVKAMSQKAKDNRQRPRMGHRAKMNVEELAYGTVALFWEWGELVASR